MSVPNSISSPWSPGPGPRCSPPSPEPVQSGSDSWNSKDPSSFSLCTIAKAHSGPRRDNTNSVEGSATAKRTKDYKGKDDASRLLRISLGEYELASVRLQRKFNIPHCGTVKNKLLYWMPTTDGEAEKRKGTIRPVRWTDPP